MHFLCPWANKDISSPAETDVKKQDQVRNEGNETENKILQQQTVK